jgi:hypothetical protein
MELDVLGLSHDRLLALQDIVSGEFLGTISSSTAAASGWRAPSTSRAG